MLANAQLITAGNEREDLTTFVAIPVDSLKNPADHNLKVIQNLVIKQLPDGTICLADSSEEKQDFIEEPYSVTETVPLKLINDSTEKPPTRNHTILLHPPLRKHAVDKPIKQKPSQKKLEPKPTQEQYRCIKCDKSFDTISQYQNHITWHKYQKRFKCEKCSSGYNVENNLKIHMVLMHSEQRNMECPICHVSLTFQRTASLKSHLMLHQVEEFYTCDECEADFDKQEVFIKHMESHTVKKKLDSKPLTCSHCKLEFKEPKEFRTHLADHAKLRKTFMRNRRPRKPANRKGESGHVCFICNKSFIKNSLLERHLRIHSGEKPFKCQFCSRCFTQKGTLQIHLSKHAGIKPYACTLCPARFNQKGNLQAHVRKTHTFPAEKDQKMYKCSQCTCIFKKISTLNGHVTKAHLNTKDTSKLDDGLIEDVMSKLRELEQQTSGIPPSERTGKGKENDLREHIVIENKDVEIPDFGKENFVNLTESTGDGSIKKYLVRQKKIGDVRWYFCNYCSKQFKKPSDLIRHMRVHTKEKPFKCQQCSSEFTLKSTLLAHIKTHTNKMNYTCKICDSSFISLRVLNAHLRKHDFESLPKWQCITCGFLYDNLEQGVKHREKMGTEKPHIVQPFINYILKQPLYQTTYGSLPFKPPKTRIPNTGSESPTLRPFHCTICDARFTRRINLKRHIQFHNGDRNFKCTLCPKTFITSYRLKEHLNFHNNVKNYACKLCDKKFVTATLLKRHVIVHNSHKPYQCPYCAKTFKTLLLCRTHIMKVHKKEVVSKLSLESEGLTVREPASDRKENVLMEAASTVSENSVLQDLPQSSNNENIVMEQLLPQAGNCIQIMNPDGTTAELGNYSTIYVNMNDLHLLDTTNLSLSSSNDPQLKLQNTDASLINNQENMGVNDIIFNIDPMKTGLSLPPEEIFDTPHTESIDNQSSATLPSLEDISGKTIELNDFSEENISERSDNLNTLLGNSTNLYSNALLKDYLNLSLSDEEGSGDFDPTASNQVLQLAVNDATQTGDIYENTNIMCISCGRLFVTLDIFQAHSCGPESVDEENCQDDADASVHEEEPECNGTKDFMCAVCENTFPDKTALDQHIGGHTSKLDVVCSECKAVVKGKREYAKHMAAHKATRGLSLRSCKFCYKEFKKPSDLKRHLRTHTGEKPFGCHLCGKTFSLKSTLESHIKTHDPTPKQFSCNVCNSCFSSKSSLKVHMTIHTGQRPHRCSFCDQKFRTVGNRKSHESLMHLSKTKKSRESKQTRVKNVLESVASGIISSLNEIQPKENDLATNNDTVPNIEDTSEKIVSEAAMTTENLLSTLQDDPISMDPVLFFQQLQLPNLIVANESTESVSTLLLEDGTILNVDATKDNIPELSLQPVEPEPVQEVVNNLPVKPEKVRNLECEICHKMYASKDVLRRHRKKVHGVNKNYPCIKCDRAFDTQDELSKHNKWHDGYRAFSCMYCANTFSEVSGLKSHIKRMHQHSNATKTTTSALLDVNFDLPPDSMDDPLLNNLFTFKT